MRTFFSSTLAIALLFAGVLSFAPRTASAQVDDASDPITEEDLASLLERKTAGLSDDGWSVESKTAASDGSHLNWTHAHKEHECPVQSFIGFGKNAQKQLDAMLAEHRDRKGGAVKTVEHDGATEFLLTVQGDTVGRAGRWNILAEGQWVDASSSGCDASTAAAIKWVGSDLLEDMAEHLHVPVHKFLKSLLPDSVNGRARSNVTTQSLEKAGAPEAPGVRIEYQRPFEIGALYGDAAKQVTQLVQRGKFGQPPVTAVSNGDRTFYVAGDNDRKKVTYFSDPVVFLIEVRPDGMRSSKSAKAKSPRQRETALLKQITEALELDKREPIEAPSRLYDEASVRAFWQSTSIYGPDRPYPGLAYQEDAPNLLPSYAPDDFSYRFAGLGGRGEIVSIGIPLPVGWTTIPPPRRGMGGIAFVRSAEDFDTETVEISSSPISLKADDNVIVQATVPSRRGSGPSPTSMIDDLVDQAPLKEAMVVQEPADTTLSGHDAVRATVGGTDADGRPARYYMFGVSVEGTTLMLAVLRPEAAAAETKKLIQTALNHLDIRKI